MTSKSLSQILKSRISLNNFGSRKYISNAVRAVQQGAPRLPVELKEYPWLPSTCPTRSPPLNLWSSVKQKHFLKLGLKKAEKCFPGYDFPRAFLKDAALVCQQTFDALSRPELAGSVDALQPLMSLILAEKFVDGYESLQRQGLTPKFILHSEPKLHLKGINLTYGPYPPPSDYIIQHWWSVMTLVIPPEEAPFISADRQQEILKLASEDGVYIRINVQMNADIELLLVDSKSQKEFFKDKREFVDLEFTTPHFTPWDEVVGLDKNGDWQLRWKWRLTDMDALIESQDFKPLFAHNPAYALPPVIKPMKNVGSATVNAKLGSGDDSPLAPSRHSEAQGSQ
jgi:hypothetical protein